jgi:hypothetical protein
LCGKNGRPQGVHQVKRAMVSPVAELLLFVLSDFVRIFARQNKTIKKL